MVHFVAIPRPEIAHQLLEAKLNDCQCDLAIPALETIHDNDNFMRWTFKDMVGSIFLILASVMENLKVGHIRGAHAAARGQTDDDKWPSSTASIFPRGPEEAIASFTTLYCLTRASSILDFIRLALPHSPSLAAPAVNSPPFWNALLEELQRAVDKIDMDPRIIGIEPESNNFEDGPPPTHSIQAIAMLIHTLLFTFTESLRQNIQSSALLPYARNIHDLLIKVLIRTDRSPSKAKLTEFSYFITSIGMTIVTTLPKNHPQHPRALHPVLLAYAQTLRGGDASTVYSVISHLTQSVAECCSATCSATSESSTQKLRHCAQCQVMRYCSGACQKAAWKYHKLVRRDLEKLKKEVLPQSSRSPKGPFGQFLRELEKEAARQGFTKQRMKELAAELAPFLHFQNAGITKAASHETANHY
ncbi:hypothetical protein DFH09DRAFT_227974 [Mycena vulgaris]|nr:hypothetical protein DFH09DRAFT_227974 [Mycena vulgaris]